MRELFKNIVAVQIGASIAIIFMLIFRKVFKKRYVAKLRYWLWIIIAVRLCLPIDINMRLNRPAPINIPTDNYYISLSGDTNTEQVENTTQFEIISSDKLLQKTKQVSTTPNENRIVKYQKPLSLNEIRFDMWIIVALSLVAISFYQYFTAKNRLFENSRNDKNLNLTISKIRHEMGIKRNIKARVCDYIGSPMLVGMFKPVIVFPKDGYGETETEMIIRHELTHFRRNDVIYKLIFHFISCVYWFNPLMKVMEIYAEKDVEISCDEDAVKYCTRMQKAEYAQTILKVINMKNNKLILSTSFSQNAKNVKERFSNILFGKNLKKGRAITALMLVMVLSVTSLVGCSSNFSVGIKEDKDYSVSVGNISNSRCIFDTYDDAYLGIYQNLQPFDTDDMYLYFDKAQNSKGGSYYNAFVNDEGKIEILCNKENCNHNDKSCNAYIEASGDFFSIDGVPYIYTPVTFDSSKENQSSQSHISVLKVSENGTEVVADLKDYYQAFGSNVYTDGKDLYTAARDFSDGKTYLIKIDMSTGEVVLKECVSEDAPEVRIQGITDDKNQILYTTKMIGTSEESDTNLNVYNIGTDTHETVKTLSAKMRLTEDKMGYKDSFTIKDNYIYCTDIENSRILKQKIGTEETEVLIEGLNTYLPAESVAYRIKYFYEDNFVLCASIDNGQKYCDEEYVSINCADGTVTPLTMRAVDGIGMNSLIRVYSATPNNLLIAKDTSTNSAVHAEFALMSKADFFANNPRILPLGMNACM